MKINYGDWVVGEMNIGLITQVGVGCYKVIDVPSGNRWFDENFFDMDVEEVLAFVEKRHGWGGVVHIPVGKTLDIRRMLKKCDMWKL